MLRWRYCSLWRRALRWLVLLLLLPTLAFQLHAGAPPDTPFLRIETGMHTAMINRIDLDAAERWLVTASDDKTARVWDLTSGKLLQTMRPPLGSGNESKLYAVAISPDGETVAVGGWTGWDWGGKCFIYLFDRASGKLTRRSNDLPNGILHLAYSPDGRYLAAALGRDNGVRVYRASDLAEVGQDTDYGSDSNWVEFDRRGRLVSASYDGYVRLYSADFKLIAKWPAPGDKQPFSARFSPSGDKVAVGFNDSTTVNVLSGEDLSLLYAPATQGVDNGDLSTVAWSQDGQTLYAGGTYFKESMSTILTWNQAGGGPVADWPASTSTIMDLRALKNGRLAFGAQDPAIGLFDANGRKVWALSPFIPDHRSNQEKFLVSQDGSRIQFSFDVLNAQGKWNQRPARLDVSQREFTLPVAEAEAKKKSKLSPPRTTAPGLDITGWEDTTEPRLNGQALPLEPYETARSLAIAPDNQHFLLGTEWSLHLFDRQGRQQWQAPVPGGAWAVNISGDGRFAVVAFSDGTIRWYQLENGKERLAFFAHADGKRWVLWTPEGFFAASQDGEQLIGYHLNQGVDQEGQFVQADQLFDLFYKPELVAQSLTPAGERAIQSEVARIGDVRQVLAGGPPPELELVSQRREGANLILDIRVKEQRGGVGKLIYRINGVEQATRYQGIGIPGYKPIQISIPLPAAAGESTVEFIAYNRSNQVASQPLTMTADNVGGQLAPSSLYVLALGVSRYKDPNMTLKYAADDARNIGAELQQHGQRLFQAVKVKSLLDDQATLAGIGNAFEELAGQVRESDVFVLFLAGHGIVLSDMYHFIPYDAIYSSENAFREGSVSEQRLRDWLAKIRARKSLIILDTCYAGAAGKLASVATTLAARGGPSEQTAITRLYRATGRAVLAASSSSQLALEGYQGHGFFTSALLTGLQGEADRAKDGAIEVLELAKFVQDEVPKISNERQFPVFESQGLIDFPIGLTTRD